MCEDSQGAALPVGLTSWSTLCSQLTKVLLLLLRSPTPLMTGSLYNIGNYGQTPHHYPWHSSCWYPCWWSHLYEPHTTPRLCGMRPMRPACHGMGLCTNRAYLPLLHFRPPLSSQSTTPCQPPPGIATGHNATGCLHISGHCPANTSMMVPLAPLPRPILAVCVDCSRTRSDITWL